MRLGGGRGGLRSRLLGGLGLFRLHVRLVVADGTTGGSAQHGMVAGHVARHAAHSRTGHASGCVSRQRRRQENRKSKNTN